MYLPRNCGWTPCPSVPFATKLQQRPFNGHMNSPYWALLRKGNPCPLPGPDLWEKWCTKSLNEAALQLVLDLVNYKIVKSHLPDSAKPAVMSTIFKRATISKRGSRTDLTNYPGITCSSLIKNLPFAWLNHLLSAFVTNMGILPQAQIVTQPGVQARDLTSFLSQVDAYAHRHSISTPLFVLHHDWCKGWGAPMMQ